MIKDFCRAMRGLCEDPDDVIGGIALIASIAGFWILAYAMGGR